MRASAKRAKREAARAEMIARTPLPAGERDYIIKCGDERLCWIEAGAEPGPEARRLIAAYARVGTSPLFNEVDGHRWAWVGKHSMTSRFTWQEARAVLWRKLKTCTRDGLGNRHKKPLADRWAYKLCRLVPKGDTIRPRGER